jgi:EAL domain-containing protein (putative c-di-GMP-specific phosphodiesterase class I)
MYPRYSSRTRLSWLHAEQASINLKALRALGLRIALDDFGCGYSSLNYLRHLAVDYLKIDQSFVDDIIDSPRDQAVAKAIIELAKSLGISVVAEGVETEAQARFFTDACCHELQGFLFSKAVGAKDLGHLLPQPSPAVA